jgi:hypothetical protein
MDMTESIAPKSDQLDAVDLLSGPRTFTIERVTANNPEQPFNFHLAEFPRVWRPGKSMRRVIVAAWGPDASKYAGQRITLYCDASVQFGGEVVGGSRISHMSGIDKPLKVPLLIKRGKSALFTVQPLPAEAPKKAPARERDWLAEAQLAEGDADSIKALWYAARDAGAPKETLNAIFAMTAPIATPADEPAA